MTHIKVEIDKKYREALDVLKQVIPDEKGELVESDSQIVEILIDSFMAFIQEQAAHHAHDHEGGCCGGGEGHDHGHHHEHGKEEGGCCRH
ncbi:MAG: hypothetical protein PHS49_03790 [Candidatus Gracilibacteria bacterium]|nr:hypothetical protein [Candidatus Gracilibacteria bacterium]